MEESKKTSVKSKGETDGIGTALGALMMVKTNRPLLASAVVLALLFVEAVLLMYVLVRVFTLQTSGNFKRKVHSLSHELLSNYSANYKKWTLMDILSSMELNYHSCEEVLIKNPSATSGYYFVWSGVGELSSIYCDMTLSCGDIVGGWMRVTRMDLDRCPFGLKPGLINGSQRSCVVNHDLGDCTSVLFGSFNHSYSKVCGKIRALMSGNLDGFHANDKDLNSDYLDGISVTIGSNHIFSFTGVTCDCSTVPTFVAHNFVCDSGNCSSSTPACDGRVLFAGNECGPSIPYFFRTLQNHTYKDISVKICRDEARNIEDVPITVLELYVR